MLFKHTSPTAKSARFFAAEVEKPFEQVAEQTSDAPKLPSKQEREINRLNAEVEALQRQIDDLTAKWDEKLGEAYNRALAEAADRHVRDETKVSAAAVEALSKARCAFEADMCERAERFGPELAREALGRLVTVSEGESDWLTRAITRRVAELRAGSVVALHLAPQDLSEELQLQVRDALPAGTELIPDREIRPGTALIKLRLGAVVIDPRQGMQEIVEAIDVDRP